MANVTYYATFMDDKPTRLVQFEDHTPHVWENGDWKYSPAHIKVINDITDYDEVTKNDAIALIERL